jgi:hypothetical protein
MLLKSPAALSGFGDPPRSRRSTQGPVDPRAALAEAFSVGPGPLPLSQAAPIIRGWERGFLEDNLGNSEDFG